MGAEQAEAVLLRATGRDSVEEALDWIGADHPILDNTQPRELLRAVIDLESSDVGGTEAVRRLTRALVASDLDTAAVLFEADGISKPFAFRRVLDLVAQKSSGRSLAGISASVLIAAQREEPFAIEALCAVAGLAYSDLKARAEVGLPAHPQDHWTAPQVRAAFDAIDAVVRDRIQTEIPGACPARPLELMPDLVGRQFPPGWVAVEAMRCGGVPYETLLAQRAAGGAWLAHRNRTSGKVAHAIAGQVCRLLDDGGLEYRRSTSVGGNTKPSDIHELSGAGKQVGVVVVDGRGKALCGVIFSVARDSGTASKNASRLRTMPRASELPLILVLAGAGWAARNETADLAVAFQGHIYTERASNAATEAVAELVATQRSRGR